MSSVEGASAPEDRERFFNRIAFLPEADRMRIQLAYTLAKFAHRAQVRKEPGPDGKPLRYFEHVRRVALVLIDELKIARPEMITAALLHDGIEDTRDLTPDVIEFHFGADVGTLVKLLSKVPKEGFADRLLHFGDWRALMIKGCDRLDNLRSLGAGTRDSESSRSPRRAGYTTRSSTAWSRSHRTSTAGRQRIYATRS